MLQGRNVQSGPAAFFTLGHAALGLLLQLLATFGFFSWVVLTPILLGILGLAVWCRLFPRFDRHKLLMCLAPDRPLSRLLACGVIAITILLLACSVSVPGTDALAYYMAQPKLMAATHGYALLPSYEIFATLPGIAEIHYGVMYAFGGGDVGQLAAKLLMWPVFVAILGLIWGIGRGLGYSKDACWLLLAAGVTSTAATLIVWDGKTDLVGALYALAAVYWMPGLFAEDKNRTLIALFGIMTATAVLAKFSFALTLPFCVGLPLFFQWRHDKFQLLRIFSIAGIVALAVFVVGWWLKNAVLFGDPFAPLLVMRPETPMFPLEQAWFSTENTRWITLTYPLALTFGMYPMQHGGITPLWLVLLPALATRPWRNVEGKKAIYLATGGLLAIFIWLLLRPSVLAPRYILPALILPLFVLVAGYDLWLRRQSKLAQLALLAMIAIVGLHGLKTLYYIKVSTLPYARAIMRSPLAHPLIARAKRLALEQRKDAKCLLLSYSSEMLPEHLLTSFVLASPPQGDILTWALHERIDYIIHDPITHKRDDLDLPPPLGLKVEKIEYAKGVYNLYVLTRIQDVGVIPKASTEKQELQ